MFHDTLVSFAERRVISMNKFDGVANTLFVPLVYAVYIILR